MQRRSEHAYRDIPGPCPLVVTGEHLFREALEQPARDEVEDQRPKLCRLHAGDERRRNPALRDLVLVAPEKSTRSRPIGHERRFEDGGPLYGGESECGVQQDDGSRADPKDEVSAASS